MLSKPFLFTAPFLLLRIIKCLLQCCWIKKLDLYLLPYQFPWVVTVLEMTIICRRSQNDEPGKPWMYSFLLFFLCTLCQIAHTQLESSSLIFMTKTGVFRKMTLWKLQMDGSCSLSDSVASFFFNNRVFLLPAIVLLIHLSGCVTSVMKPESWSILGASSNWGSKFHTLSFMTSLFCLCQV